MSEWFILRTSGPRTLPLARSLADAGLDVWTPTATTRQRVRGRRKRIERSVPIAPTFVFARAKHLRELAMASVAQNSPHPPFSLFKWNGRIPMIAESEVLGLREEERIEHDRAEVRHRADAEIARRGEKDAMRRVIPKGQTYSPTHGPFAGMSGVVEGGDRKEASVVFGGTLRVKIDTWLIVSDGIGIPEPFDLGKAA